MFPHIPLFASANLAALKKPRSDRIGSDRIGSDRTGSDRSDRIDQTGSEKKLDWTGSEHGSGPRSGRRSDYKVFFRVLISRSSSKGKRLWVSKSNMADKTSYRSYFPATAARFVKKTVPFRTILN